MILKKEEDTRAENDLWDYIEDQMRPIREQEENDMFEDALYNDIEEQMKEIRSSKTRFNTLSNYIAELMDDIRNDDLKYLFDQNDRKLKLVKKELKEVIDDNLNPRWKNKKAIIKGQIGNVIDDYKKEDLEVIKDDLNYTILNTIEANIIEELKNELFLDAD